MLHTLTPSCVRLFRLLQPIRHGSPLAPICFIRLLLPTPNRSSWCSARRYPSQFLLHALIVAWVQRLQLVFRARPRFLVLISVNVLLRYRYDKETDMRLVSLSSSCSSRYPTLCQSQLALNAYSRPGPIAPAGIPCLALRSTSPLQRLPLLFIPNAFPVSPVMRS